MCEALGSVPRVQMGEEDPKAFAFLDHFCCPVKQTLEVLTAVEIFGPKTSHCPGQEFFEHRR